MIDRENFEQLAGAAACGEATAEERAELDAVLATEPILAAEWAQAQATDAALRRAASPPAASAIPVPPPVLARLEAARQEALAARLASEAHAGGAENVIAFQHEPPAAEAASSPRGAARPAFFGKWLALAACLALLLGLAAVWWIRPGTSAAIAVLAPKGETGVTQPRLVWDARPGQRYDVWVLPPEGSHITAPALFVAKSVQPPVAFSDLKPAPALQEQSRPSTRLEPNTDYRLLVCLADAGRIAGVAVPFRTAADATRTLPPPSFDAAKKLAASRRPADALMLLAQLPPAEREHAEARALERNLRSRLSKLPSAAPIPAP